MSGHYPALRREISSVDLDSAPSLRSSAMEPSIYQYPDVFRRAHLESPGEIPAEVIFLQQVWQRHRKSPTRRILDIACGDSPHGRLLAGDGFEVVGIDRSPTMIAAGRRKANARESSLLPPADRTLHSPRARLRRRNLHVRNISGDRRERRACSRISSPSAARSSAAACTASTSIARIRLRACRIARCGANVPRAPAESRSTSASSIAPSRGIRRCTRSTSSNARSTFQQAP